MTEGTPELRGPVVNPPVEMDGMRWVSISFAVSETAHADTIQNALRTIVQHLSPIPTLRDVRLHTNVTEIRTK